MSSLVIDDLRVRLFDYPYAIARLNLRRGQGNGSRYIRFYRRLGDPTAPKTLQIEDAPSVTEAERSACLSAARPGGPFDLAISDIVNEAKRFRALHPETRSANYRTAEGQPGTLSIEYVTDEVSLGLCLTSTGWILPAPASSNLSMRIVNRPQNLDETLDGFGPKSWTAWQPGARAFFMAAFDLLALFETQRALIERNLPR